MVEARPTRTRVEVIRRVANGSWLVVVIGRRRATSRTAWSAAGGHPRQTCVARFHQPAHAGRSPAAALGGSPVGQSPGRHPFGSRSATHAILIAPKTKRGVGRPCQPQGRLPCRLPRHAWAALSVTLRPRPGHAGGGVVTTPTPRFWPPPPQRYSPLSGLPLKSKSRKMNRPPSSL